MAILTGMNWYLIVILIYISLIIRNVEHLFMCLLVICMSSLEKYLFILLAHFFIQLFFWLWAVGSVYLLEINPLFVTLSTNIFSILWANFCVFLDISFVVKKTFKCLFFYFYYSRNQIQKDTAAVYVLVCSAYVFP